MPSLASPFLVFAQCLAYAAPVWARLRRRPIAWCFHGPDGSGRDALPGLAASVYGAVGEQLTWQMLQWDMADTLATRQEGLLVIGDSSEPDQLEQTVATARMWHDHDPDPDLAHRRDAIAIFDNTAPIDVHMLRARFGPGKVWLFNVPADARAGHGIYVQRPEDGESAGVAGSAAMLLTRAYKAPCEAGMRWLRFVNWWPEDKLAALFHDEAAATLDQTPLDPRTGMSAADLGHCFNVAAAAGEWATKQGLTGWPTGAAFDASQQVLAAWGRGALGVPVEA